MTIHVRSSIYSSLQDYEVLTAGTITHRRIINVCQLMNDKESKTTIEPSREKTNNLDFRPGPTQTSLYSNRRKLEA